MSKAANKSALALGLALSLVVLGSTRAPAKSQLLLPFPTDTGRVAAHTYDARGNELGSSEFALEPTEDGHFVMEVTIGAGDGAHNRIRAELEAVEGDDAPGSDARHLRILTEESQSFTATGDILPLLSIDHTAGRASCTPHGGDPHSAQVLELPDDDRVANVPLNLLFLPLVRGEVESVKFQIFVCTGGPKLHDFVARTTGPVRQDGPRRILQVSYEPDLGGMMRWIARRIAPKLSFWFDQSRDGAYIGHRMPLYSKGPDVLMVRSGVRPPALGAPF